MPSQRRGAASAKKPARRGGVPTAQELDQALASLTDDDEDDGSIETTGKQEEGEFWRKEPPRFERRERGSQHTHRR